MTIKIQDTITIPIDEDTIEILKDLVYNNAPSFTWRFHTNEHNDLLAVQFVKDCDGELDETPEEENEWLRRGGY